MNFYRKIMSRCHSTDPFSSSQVFPSVGAYPYCGPGWTHTMKIYLLFLLFLCQMESVVAKAYLQRGKSIHFSHSANCDQVPGVCSGISSVLSGYDVLNCYCPGYNSDHDEVVSGGNGIKMISWQVEKLCNLITYNYLANVAIYYNIANGSNHA